tara:strand:- start:80979 stop:89423 length:8445 start_codon:yes stop_codon:yes gene_type:complete
MSRRSNSVKKKIRSANMSAEEADELGMTVVEESDLESQDSDGEESEDSGFDLAKELEQSELRGDEEIEAPSSEDDDDDGSDDIDESEAAKLDTKKLDKKVDERAEKAVSHHAPATGPWQLHPKNFEWEPLTKKFKVSQSASKPLDKGVDIVQHKMRVFLIDQDGTRKQLQTRIMSPVVGKDGKPKKRKNPLTGEMEIFFSPDPNASEGFYLDRGRVGYAPSTGKLYFGPDAVGQNVKVEYYLADKPHTKFKKLTPEREEDLLRKIQSGVGNIWTLLLSHPNRDFVLDTAIPYIEGEIENLRHEQEADTSSKDERTIPDLTHEFMQLEGMLHDLHDDHNAEAQRHIRAFVDEEIAPKLARFSSLAYLLVEKSYEAAKSVSSDDEFGDDFAEFGNKSMDPEFLEYSHSLRSQAQDVNGTVQELGRYVTPLILRVIMNPATYFPGSKSPGAWRSIRKTFEAAGIELQDLYNAMLGPIQEAALNFDFDAGKGKGDEIQLEGEEETKKTDAQVRFLNNPWVFGRSDGKSGGKLPMALRKLYERYKEETSTSEVHSVSKTVEVPPGGGVVALNAWGIQPGGFSVTRDSDGKEFKPAGGKAFIVEEDTKYNVGRIAYPKKGGKEKLLVLGPSGKSLPLVVMRGGSVKDKADYVKKHDAFAPASYSSHYIYLPPHMIGKEITVTEATSGASSVEPGADEYVLDPTKGTLTFSPSNAGETIHVKLNKKVTPSRFVTPVSTGGDDEDEVTFEEMVPEEGATPYEQMQQVRSQDTAEEWFSILADIIMVEDDRRLDDKDRAILAGRLGLGTDGDVLSFRQIATKPPFNGVESDPGFQTTVTEVRKRLERAQSNLFDIIKEKWELTDDPSLDALAKFYRRNIMRGKPRKESSRPDKVWSFFSQKLGLKPSQIRDFLKGDLTEEDTENRVRQWNDIADKLEATLEYANLTQDQENILRWMWGIPGPLRRDDDPEEKMLKSIPVTLLGPRKVEKRLQQIAKFEFGYADPSDPQNLHGIRQTYKKAIEKFDPILTALLKTDEFRDAMNEAAPDFVGYVDKLHRQHWKRQQAEREDNLDADADESEWEQGISPADDPKPARDSRPVVERLKSSLPHDDADIDKVARKLWMIHVFNPSQDPGKALQSLKNWLYHDVKRLDAKIEKELSQPSTFSAKFQALKDARQQTLDNIDRLDQEIADTEASLEEARKSDPSRIREEIESLTSEMQGLADPEFDIDEEFLQDPSVASNDGPQAEFIEKLMKVIQGILDAEEAGETPANFKNKFQALVRAWSKEYKGTDAANIPDNFNFIEDWEDEGLEALEEKMEFLPDFLERSKARALAADRATNILAKVSDLQEMVEGMKDLSDKDRSKLAELRSQVTQLKLERSKLDGVKEKQDEQYFDLRDRIKEEKEELREDLMERKERHPIMKHNDIAVRMKNYFDEAGPFKLDHLFKNPPDLTDEEKQKFLRRFTGRSSTSTSKFDSRYEKWKSQRQVDLDSAPKRDTSKQDVARDTEVGINEDSALYTKAFVAAFPDLPDAAEIPPLPQKADYVNESDPKGKQKTQYKSYQKALKGWQQARAEAEHAFERDYKRKNAAVLSLLQKIMRLAAKGKESGQEVKLDSLKGELSDLESSIYPAVTKVLYSALGKNPSEWDTTKLQTVPVEDQKMKFTPREKDFTKREQRTLFEEIRDASLPVRPGDKAAVLQLRQKQFRALIDQLVEHMYHGNPIDEFEPRPSKGMALDDQDVVLEAVEDYLANNLDELQVKPGVYNLTDIYQKTDVVPESQDEITKPQAEDQFVVEDAETLHNAQPALKSANEAAVLHGLIGKLTSGLSLEDLEKKLQGASVSPAHQRVQAIVKQLKLFLSRNPDAQGEEGFDFSGLYSGDKRFPSYDDYLRVVPVREHLDRFMRSFRRNLKEEARLLAKEEGDESLEAIEPPSATTTKMNRLLKVMSHVASKGGNLDMVLDWAVDYDSKYGLEGPDSHALLFQSMRSYLAQVNRKLGLQNSLDDEGISSLFGEGAPAVTPVEEQFDEEAPSPDDDVVTPVEEETHYTDMFDRFFEYAEDLDDKEAALAELKKLQYLIDVEGMNAKDILSRLSADEDSPVDATLFSEFFSWVASIPKEEARSLSLSTLTGESLAKTDSAPVEEAPEPSDEDFDKAEEELSTTDSADVEEVSDIETAQQEIPEIAVKGGEWVQLPPGVLADVLDSFNESVQNLLAAHLPMGGTHLFTWGDIQQAETDLLTEVQQVPGEEGKILLQMWEELKRRWQQACAKYVLSEEEIATDSVEEEAGESATPTSDVEEEAQSDLDEALDAKQEYLKGTIFDQYVAAMEADPQQTAILFRALIDHGIDALTDNPSEDLDIGDILEIQTFLEDHGLADADGKIVDGIRVPEVEDLADATVEDSEEVVEEVVEDLREDGEEELADKVEDSVDDDPFAEFEPVSGTELIEEVEYAQEKAREIGDEELASDLDKAKENIQEIATEVSEGGEVDEQSREETVRELEVIEKEVRDNGNADLADKIKQIQVQVSESDEDDFMSDFEAGDGFHPEPEEDPKAEETEEPEEPEEEPAPDFDNEEPDFDGAEEPEEEPELEEEPDFDEEEEPELEEEEPEAAPASQVPAWLLNRELPNLVPTGQTVKKVFMEHQGNTAALYALSKLRQDLLGPQDLYSLSLEDLRTKIFVEGDVTSVLSADELAAFIQVFQDIATATIAAYPKKKKVPTPAEPASAPVEQAPAPEAAPAPAPAATPGHLQVSSLTDAQRKTLHAKLVELALRNFYGNGVDPESLIKPLMYKKGPEVAEYFKNSVLPEVLVQIHSKIEGLDELDDI